MRKVHLDSGSTYSLASIGFELFELLNATKR